MTTSAELSLIPMVPEAVVLDAPNPSIRVKSLKAPELYRRLLETDDDQEALTCRTELLFTIADPLIQGIVYRLTGVRLGNRSSQPSSRDEEAEEIRCLSLEAMAQQIERWRDSPEAAPAELNFEAYVNTVTHRARMQWIRKTRGKYIPSSMELSDLLNPKHDLAAWTDARGELLGGYVLWRDGRTAPASEDRVREILHDPIAAAKRGLAQQGHKQKLAQTNPVDILKALLNCAGGPVKFGDLVMAFDDYRSFWESIPSAGTEVPLEPCSEDPYFAGPSVSDRADPDADVAVTRQSLDFLRSLWAYADDLPLKHRIALFLNLRNRDADIEQILLLGIAKFDEVARMVGREPEALATIWNRLPLDDEEIAAEMQCTVAQVRNLRQSAYSALAWRFRAYHRADLRALWHAAIALEAPRPAVTLLYLRDRDNVSILTILPDVSTREAPLDKRTIARVLKIEEALFDRLWKRLPLNFEAIGDVVDRTRQEVYALWVESRELLKERLRVIWG